MDWARIAYDPPEWVQAETKALAELESTGEPVRYEKEYIRKDGSRVPIELACSRGEVTTRGDTEHYYCVHHRHHRSQAGGGGAYKHNGSAEAAAGGNDTGHLQARGNERSLYVRSSEKDSPSGRCDRDGNGIYDGPRWTSSASFPPFMT